MVRVEQFSRSIRPTVQQTSNVLHPGVIAVNLFWRVDRVETENYARKNDVFTAEFLAEFYVRFIFVEMVQTLFRGSAVFDEIKEN